MWIEPYKDKFRAIERYIDPVTGKQKRASTIIEKDTRQARKAAETTLRTKIESLTSSLGKNKITLKDLSGKYLADQKRNIKESSYLSTEIHLNNLLDILDPNAIISKLTARYVYDKITEKSTTPYETNRNILYFKAMINWGYRHDYVDDKTWLDKIQRIKVQKTHVKIEEQYLEPEELKLLLEEIPQKHWRLLTQFLVLSGLRIGEAMALMDEDVDDYIHITKTYHSVTGILNKSAKTKTSNRDVYIQPELAEVIKKIRTYQKEVRLATGKQSDIFLPMPYGGVVSYNAYQKRLLQYSRLVLKKNVRPHMLRHTHVSLLAEQGVPLEVISRRLGHKDSQITEDVYLHVTKKRKKAEEEMISKVKIL